MRECLYWIKIHFVYDLITYWILWYLLQYEVFASCHACMIWRHLCMDDHVKSKQRKSCNVLLLNHYFYNITPLALSWGKILFCFNYDLIIAVFYMDLYALRVHKTNPITGIVFCFSIINFYVISIPYMDEYVYVVTSFLVLSNPNIQIRCRVFLKKCAHTPYWYYVF